METKFSKNILLSVAKITSIIVLIFSMNSCSSDDDNNPVSDETAGLVKIQTIENDMHSIELYSQSGTLVQGYNSVSFRIKDKSNSNYITPSSLSWMPMMHMTNMMHAGPFSEIKAISGTNLYSGYLVFQMAENASEFWKIRLKYSVNGQEHQLNAPISVVASAKQRVTTVTGSDGVKYILALIEPTTPKVALNDITVGVFKMASMTSFPIVDNMKISIDPRMPSMGNHGSPNNISLTQSTLDRLYYGKLSLTMTGYWKVNMQLFDASNVLVAGQSIEGAVENSTLYFEVEF